MGNQLDKLMERFSRIPSDFTFAELRTLLEHLGYKLQNKGTTSGSRVLFYRESDGRMIQQHKPHPGNIVKQYALRDVKSKLIEGGDLIE